jgi:hypothetical protein
MDPDLAVVEEISTERRDVLLALPDASPIVTDSVSMTAKLKAGLDLDRQVTELVREGQRALGIFSRGFVISPPDQITGKTAVDQG